MRPCLTEHAHHPREYRVGPGAYVERLRQPRLIDPDHLSSSHSLPAQAPVAFTGHSIVIRDRPLRMCTRIGRCSLVNSFPDSSYNGMKLTGALDRAVGGMARLAALIEGRCCADSEGSGHFADRQTEMEQAIATAKLQTTLSG